MSRGKRLGARRRKLLGARSQPVVDRGPARSSNRWKQAQEDMRRFDELPPIWRALTNFFGGDVVARVTMQYRLEAHEVAAKLGRKAEFEAYYEEAYGRRLRDVAAAEKERIASAWEGFL